ncbi:type 2 lanthipeptide synthetase LanM family protein [Cohnella suwonensis]|uniref:Type 2 lanthipeptide synthetase LanM family protein n=1 Tax=Cohnella suwonensis TaxID=696072 RepID=A0ABW0LWG9_9BACL
MREWIRDIVNQSSSMAERSSDDYRAQSWDEADAAEVRKRLTLWCDRAAKGDWDKFAARLALAGMTMDDAESMLGPVRIREAAKLPEWTTTLQLLIASIEDAGKEWVQPERLPGDPCFVPEHPIAFEHLFLPFLQAAIRSLKERAGSLADVLTPDAWHSMERSLLQSLSHVSWRSLDLEFSVYRSGAIAIPGNRTMYTRFVGEMLQGKWLGFMREYSVLAKLASITVRTWEDNLLEFLQRYEVDKPWLNESILSGQPIAGTIAALELNRSDSHNGGRSVIIVTVSDGSKLVYKPKSLSLDAAYSHLLMELRELGAPNDLLPIGQMDCGSYGWQRYIEHKPCADETEIALYYRRAGTLLCISHLLGATDLHNENVIACGAFPVLIDVETMLHPLTNHIQSDDPDADAEELAYDRKTRSLLRTLLLPSWRDLGDTGLKEISGLFGGQQNHADTITFRGLLHVNTDAMKIGDIPYVQHESTNIPFLQGRSLDFNRNSQELIQGFGDMYQFLMSQRKQLLAAGGPLSAFKGIPSRYVFRATAIYSQMLENSYRPDLLRNGIDRDIQLDAMSRFLTSDEELSDRWPLVRRELDDLWRMDIPFFQVRTDECRLTDSSGSFGPDLSPMSGYDYMLHTLQRLDETDCDFQTSLIRGALYTKLSEAEHLAPALSPFPVQVGEYGEPELSSKEWISNAEQIAVRLSREAIVASDGTRTWIAPRLGGRYPWQAALSYDLYDGHCGIALFYAALFKVTDKISYREDALATLRLLRGKIHRNEVDDFAGKGIGGFVGLGSIVYAFVRIGQLIDEPELLVDATRVAAWFTESRINADDKLDLLHGAAGAVLSLLVLYDVVPDPLILRAAEQCGEHLLRNRRLQSNGHRVWANQSGKALAGLSHGAAGIAYALLRLHALTREERFLRAAEEAIDYELSIFVPDQGIWPDLRSADKPGLTDAWCHGAAGIGLGRLVGLSILDTVEIRADIEKAIQAVRLGLHHTGRDHLCCGAMGRVEFLLSAGMRLNRKEIEREARLHASAIVRRHHGYWEDGYEPNFIYEPLGFFQGIAGIGYELLRLHDPKSLPSVLAME